MPQPCSACGTSDAQCLSMRQSCCGVCAMSAMFTHDEPSDQAACPDRLEHGGMAACSLCSYASQLIDAGR